MNDHFPERPSNGMTYAITYIYGFDEYLAAARARGSAGMFGRHVRWARPAVVVAAFVAAMFGVSIWEGTIGEMMQDSLSLGLILGGAMLVFFICLLIDFLFERVVYRWAFGRFAMANSELTVRLDAEGLHWNAPSASGTLGWPRIRRVMVTLDHIFLFISKIELMGLPRRAFATESAFHEAARYAQAQANAATGAA